VLGISIRFLKRLIESISAVSSWWVVGWNFGIEAKSLQIATKLKKNIQVADSYKSVRPAYLSIKELTVTSYCSDEFKL
jgi:hypothetical protein